VDRISKATVLGSEVLLVTELIIDEQLATPLAAIDRVRRDR
jgi:hypothetical protein